VKELLPKVHFVRILPSGLLRFQQVTVSGTLSDSRLLETFFHYFKKKYQSYEFELAEIHI
jgi:hypothetical protein